MLALSALVLTQEGGEEVISGSFMGGTTPAASTFRRLWRSQRAAGEFSSQLVPFQKQFRNIFLVFLFFWEYPLNHHLRAAGTEYNSFSSFPFGSFNLQLAAALWILVRAQRLPQHTVSVQGKKNPNKLIIVLVLHPDKTS